MFGNIVSFRPLKKDMDEAITLFSNKDAIGTVIIKNFEDYYEKGWIDENNKEHEPYTKLINELLENFPLNKEIVGEENKKKFFKLFSLIVRMRHMLKSFDDFEGKQILSDINFQDYTSLYWDIRPKHDDKNINEDIDFDETELIIKSYEVNIDYIIKLIEKCHDSHDQNEILKKIKASSKLRNKYDLFQDFLKINNKKTNDIKAELDNYVKEEKEKQLKNLIKEYELKEDETRKYLDYCSKRGYVKTCGTDIDNILHPISRFGKNNRAEKKKKIINEITTFFEKFYIW